jgi:NADH-quinone oxidoreductase subunit G
VYPLPNFCHALPPVDRGVSVIWQKSPYAIDVLSRHATALQATKIGQMHSASMNKA